MNEAIRTIERMLEIRFGKMEAQALKFGRARLARMDIQFTHIKHMADLCARYRSRARQQILAYRLWQETQALLDDPIARLYGAAEGASLHRRIDDEIKLWYFAHRDYHAMRRAYLVKCMGPRMKVDWDRAA